MIDLVHRGLLLAFAIYAGQLVPAFACACRTNEGQRNVATVALDSGKRQEIESLRFADEATVFTGEGDVDSIQGIATPAGHGPALYKEWKLSAPASGSGVFAPGAAPRQILTLVLQGSGNSSGIDFSHWTLVMQGPKANYTLFGNLVR